MSKRYYLVVGAALAAVVLLLAAAVPSQTDFDTAYFNTNALPITLTNRLKEIGDLGDAAGAMTNDGSGGFGWYNYSTDIATKAPLLDYANGVNLNAGLARYRSKLSQTQTNLYEILVVGDSITEGFSTSPATGMGRTTNSFVAHLRNRLQSRYGGSGLGFIPPWRTGGTYDPVYVYTGMTQGTVGNYSGGPGGAGRWGTTASDTIVMNNVTCSSFTIHYTESQFSGESFEVFTNSVSWGTVSQTAQTPAVHKHLNIAASLSVGSIEIRCPATTYLMFNGVSLYSSTNGIFVSGCGQSGAVMTLASTGWDTMTNANRGLTIIIMDSNDFLAQTALATYESNLTTALNFAVVDGSGMVVSGPRRTPGGAIPQSSYRSSHRSVAATLGVASASVYDRWNGETSNTWLETDGIHPSLSGHIDIGDYLTAILLGK